MRERLREILDEDLAEQLEKVVRELIHRFNPLSIIVGGSLSRKSFVRGLSDIDILIITEKPPGKDRFLLKAVKDVDIEITVVSLYELLEATSRGNDFYLSTVLNGLELWSCLRKNALSRN